MRPYRLDSTRLELRQHLSNVHIKFCDKGCAGKSGREATRYAQEALAMARSLQAAALKSDLKSDLILEGDPVQDKLYEASALHNVAVGKWRLGFMMIYDASHGFLTWIH